MLRRWTGDGMKAFRFNLESILKYRDHLEKKALKDLVDARAARSRVEDNIHGLMRTKKKISRECSEMWRRGVDVPTFRIYQGFFRKVSMDLESAHRELEEKKTEVMVREAVLRQASMKKKSLESLRELKLEAHFARLGREEQHAIDEMIVSRWERRP